MGYLPKLAAALIGGLLLLCSNVSSVPNTSVISVLCNSGGYSEGDPFATSLAFVLEELQTVTPKRKGYDYFNVSPYPNAFAYGHAACNQNLTSSDCATCLAAAKTALFGTCQSRIGSRSVLHDCTISKFRAAHFQDCKCGNVWSLCCQSCDRGVKSLDIIVRLSRSAIVSGYACHS